MATMQPLALMAWYGKLPEGLTNGQVRDALTTVMHNMFDGKENFNEGGFLTIGFAGRQPNIADWYTNNGSLYMTFRSDCLRPIRSGQMPHSLGQIRRHGEASLSRKTIIGATTQ